MYSRSRWREQETDDYDDGYYYDETVGDEFERYQYDLPPKYDGSRFIRSRAYRAIRGTSDREREVRMEGEALSDGVDCSNRVEEVCTPLPDGGLDRGGIRGILSGIGINLGYEEIVIIALIIIIAGDGLADSDVILLLALLLLGG